MKENRGRRAEGARGTSARALLCGAVLLFFPAVSSLPAEQPLLSGSVSGTADMAVDSGNPAGFLYGFEQYANIRLQADAGEKGRIHAAVNLIAASGTKALLIPEALDASFAGENYAAALELERLYLSIAGEHTDTDLGLMRIAFGSGQAFRPSDFLNPPNPLLPRARPRGVLGAAISAYPSFNSKLLLFAVSGPDPLETAGGSMLFGTSAEAHFTRGSVQGLYGYQVPDGDASLGLHRCGLSFKVETGAALVLDALYTLDPDRAADLEGLEAALGIDYSFFDGKLYLLAQYLYNGTDGQSLYASGTYSFSDITRWSLSSLLSLDDGSFSPALSVEHEPFQGAVADVTIRVPLFEEGELGSLDSGYRGALSAGITMRF